MDATTGRDAALALLQRAARERRLIVFCGSGTSMAAGLTTTWTDLLRGLLPVAYGLDEASRERIDTALNASGDCADTLLRVADYLSAQVDRRDLRQALRDALACREPRLELLTSLWSLPGLLGVVTTNYDDLLARAARAADRYPATFDNTENDAGLPLLSPPFLYFLHGRLDVPDSLVLSRGDYRRLIHGNRPARRFMQTLFTLGTVLFVGCGMRDPDWLLFLEELHEDLRGNLGGHVALMKEPADYDSHYLRGLGIRTWAYSDHAEVPGFLSALDAA